MAIEQSGPFGGTARFRVIRTLGAGGMGVVYEALDTDRNMRIAVKTLSKVEPRALYLFKHEFRSLAGVVHPNLVVLHELFSDEEQWFFTMDLVDGVGFLDHVRGRGHHVPAPSTDQPRLTDIKSIEPPEVTDSYLNQPQTQSYAAPSPELSLSPDPHAPTRTRAGATSSQLTFDFLPPIVVKSPQRRRNVLPLLNEDELRRLREGLRQLVEGVCHLHSLGKLHRDIKPSNVMVARDGRVVLLDFGLIAELTDWAPGTEGESVVAGTVGYMAPEQARGGRLSEASDWYAVGALLYEALTGVWPFEGSTSKIIAAKLVGLPVPPAELVPGLPADLSDLCLALLQTRPEDRPTAAQIVQRVTGSQQVAIPAVEHSQFIGRESDLNSLLDAYQASRQHAVTVLLHGRSGVGKSVLAEQFLTRIQTVLPTPLVFSGRCYEQESVPYKALDSLLDTICGALVKLPDEVMATLLPEDIVALARLFPVLNTVGAVGTLTATVTREIPDVVEFRRRAFAALRQLLVNLVTDRGVVLIIDDLQWGDEDSSALLADLLHPPDPPRVLLVCAYRSEYAETSPCLRTLLARRKADPSGQAWREIALGPLAAEEARSLAMTLIDPSDPATPARIDEIIRDSGGHPYFIHELAAFHSSSIASTGEMGMTLDDALWRRVCGLPGPSRRLLEVLATAGRPLRRADAYLAAGLSAADPTTLAVLRANRLVRTTGSSERDEVDSYHDRVREAVAGRIDAAIRIECHRSLAETLEATGAGDPEFLARHLHAAGEFTRAKTYYTTAAEQAVQALAFDRAAELYRLAHDLSQENDPGRQPLRVQRADALANAGRCREAAEAYVRAAEHAAPTERVELERRAAYQFCVGGHLDEGRAALGRALHQFGMKLPDNQWRALLSLLWRRLYLRVRGLGFQEREVAELTDLEKARIDVTWSAAAGLGTKNIIVAPAFGTLNLLLSLRAGDPRRIGRALAWEAAQVSNDGESAWPWVQRLIAESEKLAERLDDPYLRGLAAMARGISGFTRGRWKDGRDALITADAFFRDHCSGVTFERGQARSFMLWCISYMGDFPDMNRRSTAIYREVVEKGDLFTAANLGTYMEPLARLVADDPMEAQRVLEQSLRFGSRDRYDLQVMLHMMGSTYVDLYRGDPVGAYSRILDQWKPLKRALLLHAQLIRVVVPELRARSAIGVAATTGNKKGPLKDARYWAGKLEKERMPYADAMATLLRAGIAAVSGDSKTAIELLTLAAERLDVTDMSQFAAVARLRLGELRGGTDGKELINRAMGFMRSLEIRNPTSMAQAYAPWQPAHAPE